MKETLLYFSNPYSESVSIITKLFNSVIPNLMDFLEEADFCCSERAFNILPKCCQRINKGELTIIQIFNE